MAIPPYEGVFLPLLHLYGDGIGANVNIVSNNRTTPLHIATRLGDLDIVTLLVSTGAKKDARDGNNQTAFDIAQENGHGELATFLKEKQTAKKVVVRK